MAKRITMVRINCFIIREMLTMTKSKVRKITLRHATWHFVS
jgi:hypothetical protein